MGILEKNEMLTEDMINILETYQEYCPVIDGEKQALLCGGDGLTTKRGADAQLARSDGVTPEDRLEGLIMKSEDWHEAVLCMQVKQTYLISNLFWSSFCCLTISRIFSLAYLQYFLSKGVIVAAPLPL